jgi:hypothetical protein
MVPLDSAPTAESMLAAYTSIYAILDVVYHMPKQQLLTTSHLAVVVIPCGA